MDELDIVSFRDTKSGVALEATQVMVGFIINIFSLYFSSFCFCESQVDGNSEGSFSSTEKPQLRSIANTECGVPWT